uniref:TSA: Wollemia nobilis Ref_Wollemi_Transcript_15151_1370 transcribed RNA sequence n=1 Tax=Wollemia nobilis TaxID=56998 RepID=A0A0C9RSF6_9CONI
MGEESKQRKQSYNDEEEDLITYGDVFKFSGELAREPITPTDAALMQCAEAEAIGHATAVMQAAAVMQVAAEANERAGLVGRTRATLATNEGMKVPETALPGQIFCTEYAAGHPVHSEFEPASIEHPIAASDPITIGQALQAAAIEKGDEPIDENDARAIQAAEKRATGFPALEKGGLAATAQAAAELNPRVDDVGKTTISNVLMGASIDLPTDKAVTTKDAEKIMEAECRGGSGGHPRPGGIGEAMEAAANLNEQMAAPLALPSYAVEEEELRSQAEGMKEVSNNT